MIVYIKGCFAENCSFFCIIFNYADLIKYLFNYTEYNYNKMCNYISTKEHLPYLTTKFLYIDLIMEYTSYTLLRSVKNVLILSFSGPYFPYSD